jgi:hypothetical protein
LVPDGADESTHRLTAPLPLYGFDESHPGVRQHTCPAGQVSVPAVLVPQPNTGAAVQLLEGAPPVPEAPPLPVDAGAVPHAPFEHVPSNVQTPPLD